jgi:steroid 5-alpha reductase family enzyme
MPHATTLTVSIGYLVSSITMLYNQHLNSGLPDPAVDLLYPGVFVFAVGATGNLYHHHLLSRLRPGSGGDVGKGYKIPTGGLFELVACPNYLLEIVAFLGLAMIAQKVFALAVAFSTAAYLAGRSCATRRWYASKFEEFPARIKAPVPYVW